MDFIQHVKVIWFFYILWLLQLENNSIPEVDFRAHLPPKFIHCIM